MRILVIKDQAAKSSAAVNQRLIPALTALGHRVIPVDVIGYVPLFGHVGAQRLVLAHARAFRPQVAIACPPYDMLAPETCEGLQALDVPLIGWRYDDPLQLATLAGRPVEQMRYFALDAAKFTLNATNSRAAHDRMQALGIGSAAYLRMAADLPPLPKDAPPLPAMDIGFVGSAYAADEDQDITRRVEVLRALAQRHLHLTIVGHDWDRIPDLQPYWRGAVPAGVVPALYRNTAINLTINGWVAPMIKPRMLDIALAGGFQLVDDCDEIADYFVPGREVIVTRSLSELLYAIGYYRVNEPAARRIAHEARQRAERDHTWRARWPEWLAACEERWGRPLVEDHAPDYVDLTQWETVATAYRALLHVHEAAGQAEEAAHYADRLLAVDPRDYSARTALARWSEAAEDIHGAREHWRQAGQRFSPFTFPWSRSNQVLGLQGAGAMFPRDPSAEAIWRQFQLALVMQDREAAMALLPEMARIDFDSLLRFAEQLFRNDEYDVAMGLYQALRDEAPDDTEIALGLARSLLCTGRPEAARPVLESLLARDPKHAEARLLRSSLLS
jgi:tetratricopeptide (TPR) repeat protein